LGKSSVEKSRVEKSRNDVEVLLFVAGVLFGEIGMSLVVAGAIFGEVVVMFECNFWWQAQSLVKLQCHFSG